MSRAFRFLLVLGVATGSLIGSAEEKLDDVVRRLDTYVEEYAARLSSVVAEEYYTQTLDDADAGARPPLRNSVNTRVLKSDYALTRAYDRGAFVGYRDTFEVDGRAVRDREERLQGLLSTGEFNEATRLAQQNARFNLAGELLTRTVNVPTFALELLHPRNRGRFSIRRAGTDTTTPPQRVVLEFRERTRPTVVRTPDGRDQPTRILVVADSRTGAIWRTTLTWEKITGSIAVTYGLVPRIDVLVPLSMSERYTTRGGTRITGEATYHNYRQFQTAARVIEPR